MSHYRALHDGDGWIHTTMFVEDDELTWEGLRPDPALGPLLMAAPAIVHHDGDRYSVPHDDRALWRVLRAAGHTGGAALQARLHARELRARLGDLSATAALRPTWAMHAPDTPVGDFPDVPGLRLRAMTLEDLDAMVAIAVETGMATAATCPDAEHPCCTPPEAHPWCALARRIDNPTVYQMVLEFNGRPLQYELIEDVHTQPLVRVTIHTVRDRPSWFWREAELPVFDALRRRGHAALRTRTRKDRPDWIQSLTETYRAREIAEFEYVKVLEFPLEMTLFQGWPARRSTGQVHTVGEFTAHEVAEADIPAMVTHLRGRWRDPGDQTWWGDRLLEQYHLDRAQLVAVEHPTRAGRPDLYVIRFRRDRGGRLLGHIGVVTPMRREPMGDSWLAAHAWMRAAGYHDACGFIRGEVFDTPQMQAVMQHCGWTVKERHAQFRVPLVEVEMRLDP